MRSLALHGRMSERKPFSCCAGGKVVTALLLLCGMLAAAPASAQRRVFTNEDIAPAVEAPPAAPAAATAASSAADSPGTGQAPAESPASEPPPPTEVQRLTDILTGMGLAEEILNAKISTETSAIAIERWTAMRAQLTTIIIEFRGMMYFAERAAPPAAPPAPAVAPAP